MKWNSTIEWNPEQVSELTRLWGEQLTTAEIGKRLGVSKSTITGKVHRLKLPPRPSPIKVMDPIAAVRRRKERDAAYRRRVTIQKAALPKAATPSYKPDPALITDTSTRRSHCAFPLWAHGERSNHQYCGHPVQPNSPYCPHHHQLCCTKERTWGAKAA